MTAGRQPARHQTRLTKGTIALEEKKNDFVRCKKCHAFFSGLELKNNMYICPDCGYYMEMPCIDRIRMLTDEGSFEELYTNVEFKNVISFPGYDEVHEKQSAAYEMDDAVMTGRAKMNGIPIALAVMDSRFMMASMGRVVGEKITRLMETAAKEHLPLIIVTASGGARMQEGIVSLMQMVKTTGGASMLHAEKVPYIVVMTNPTSGGVTASFAMLGDLIFSEPNALICFAGPRVVKQTVKQELPDGFQTAESVLEHGFLDAILKREEMKDVLTNTLTFLGYGRR